jgi:DNA-binding MarR family transcriptional regulator
MTRTKKLQASDLTAHIGYWMRLISNNVSHAFARKLLANGVTVAEWVVLREMYGGDDSTSPGEIAALTGLTRGAISKLITRLLEKGLVHRQEAVEDRRYQDIELTARGRALVPKLALSADENDAEFFDCLTAQERSRLLAVLQKLAAHHQIKTAPIE